MRITLSVVFVVDDRVTEEQDTLNPVDDILSSDADSNENQAHCGCDSENVAVNTNDVMPVLPTVVSHEHTSGNVVLFDEETNKDEIRVTSEMESAQVVERHEISENCAASVPLLDIELTVCRDTEPETNTVLQECLSLSETLIKPSNESCITELAKVEIQHGKSDVISTREETALDCVVQNVFEIEEFKRRDCMQENEIKLSSESESIQVVEQNDDGENCAAAELLVESELSICTDTEPEMNIVLEKSVYGTVTKPSNDTCVTEVAQMEIQHDESDVISTLEETTLDCIQDLSRSEELECREDDGTQENTMEVPPEKELIQVIIQNDTGETYASAKPLVDSELAACSHTLAKTNCAQEHDCLLADVLPTVKSSESKDEDIVIFNHETSDVHECVVKITSETDSTSDSVVRDAFKSDKFDCENVYVEKDQIIVAAETKSAQVVRQYDSSKESCDTAASVAYLELSACSDSVSKTNSAVSGALLTSASGVDEDTEVHGKSDKISSLGETDSEGSITQDPSRSEMLDCQLIRGVDQMVVNLSEDDDVPVANRAQQEIYEAALGSTGASNVTSIPELEIQHNKSDMISTNDEIDSDCVIQDVPVCKESDFWPPENEAAMNVDLTDDDNCSGLAESLQSSTVMTGSSCICPVYTSQAGINLSLLSMQRNIFDVATATLLSFPSLNTETNTDELCPYGQFPSGENAVDNDSVYRDTHDDLMDTEISRASDLGSENGCSMMVDSSYPVVEIVPSCDDDEVSISEHSGVYPREPCTAAAAEISGLSNVVGVYGDSSILGSIVASDSSSHCGKASMMTFV